jgi:hypothetical protein
MHRHSIFISAAIVTFGLATLSGSAVAQQKSLKEQIVGAWILVSFEATAPDGKKTFVMGPKPNGVVIYDASGQFAFVFTNSDRPKWKSANRNEATTEDIKSAFFGAAAQAGPWSIDADGKTLVVRPISVLNPNNEGTEIRLTPTIVGDEMRVTQKRPDGGTFETVERRAK